MQNAIKSWIQVEEPQALAHNIIMLFREKQEARSKEINKVGNVPRDGEASSAGRIPRSEKDVKPQYSKSNDNFPGHNDVSYPSGLKLVLLMISIFISMFLVALVRSKNRIYSNTARVPKLTDLTRRINLSFQPPYQQLQTNSTPQTILAGMVQPIY